MMLLVFPQLAASLYILTVSAGIPFQPERRQATPSSSTLSNSVTRIPSTSTILSTTKSTFQPPKPTPTLVEIKSQDYPSWTVTSVPFSATPIAGPNKDAVLSQTDWVINYRDTSTLKAQQVLNVLKKLSRTTSCGVYSYGENINSEALLYFADKACGTIFPLVDAVYWLSPNTRGYHTVCGPPSKLETGNSRRICINYHVFLPFLASLESYDIPAVWLFTSQELCKAAYKQLVNFCVKDIWEGRFLNSGTQSSVGVRFNVNVYSFTASLDESEAQKGDVKVEVKGKSPIRRTNLK